MVWLNFRSHVHTHNIRTCSRTRTRAHTHIHTRWANGLKYTLAHTFLHTHIFIHSFKRSRYILIDAMIYIYMYFIIKNILICTHTRAPSFMHSSTLACTKYFSIYCILFYFTHNHTLCRIVTFFCYEQKDILAGAAVSIGSIEIPLENNLHVVGKANEKLLNVW